MSDNIKKTTAKSTSRSATSAVSKSKPEVIEKHSVNDSKREVTTKLDETKLDTLIRERAYAIWEAKGRQHGNDVEIWLQAKNAVLAQLKKSS